MFLQQYRAYAENVNLTLQASANFTMNGTYLGDTVISATSNMFDTDIYPGQSFELLTNASKGELTATVKASLGYQDY